MKRWLLASAILCMPLIGWAKYEYPSILIPAEQKPKAIALIKEKLKTKGYDVISDSADLILQTKSRCIGGALLCLPGKQVKFLFSSLATPNEIKITALYSSDAMYETNIPNKQMQVLLNDVKVDLANTARP